jgi:hypothetical protein
MPAYTPLLSPDDVAVRLGRALSDAETLKCGALINDVTSQIVRYCRRDFQMHVNETQVLYGVDSEIELEKPVVWSGDPRTAVNSVIAIGGGMGLPDVPITWFTFDGINRIKYAQGRGIINLPEVWFETDMYPGTFMVNYSWGYPQVPDEVVAVGAGAVQAVLTTPTVAAGLIGETIGPYSYRLERTGGGLTVALKQSDLDSLKDFRNTVETAEMRLR